MNFFFKSSYLKIFYFIFNNENINEYSKNIDLKTIFKNILWEIDKIINFINNFLYFPLKILSKLSWFTKNCKSISKPHEDRW